MEVFRAERHSREHSLVCFGPMDTEGRSCRKDVLAIPAGQRAFFFLFYLKRGLRQAVCCLVCFVPPGIFRLFFLEM